MDSQPERGTPEWWFRFLMNKFNERLPQDRLDKAFAVGRPTTRRDRLDLLWDYYLGNPPLPFISDAYRHTFQQVLRKARANYATMSVDVMTDRSLLHGVATAVDSDADGDDLGRAIVEASNFAAVHRDLQTYLFTMGEAYVMVIPPADGAPEGSLPIMTAEDPRYCVGYPHPLIPGQLKAALKLYEDEENDQQVAILFFDGYKFVARRESGKTATRRYNAAQWEFESDPEKLEKIDDLGGIPVVRFDNKMGLGEFEPHVDLLDRIMDGILHRLVITWYQSFRQRAIIGDLDDEEDLTEGDESGESLMAPDDIRDVFQADPGALWKVPENVKFWESSSTDLTPLITATRDDVKEFAAASRTPLHVITPDAANQTAEGASLMREALEDKIMDRQARQTPAWLQVFRLAFAFADQPARSKGLRLLWAPVKRNTLADKGSASAQARDVLSRQRLLVDVWGYSPSEAKQILLELESDKRAATLATLLQNPRLGDALTALGGGGSASGGESDRVPVESGSRTESDA